MSEAVRNPFAALLGVVPARLPTTTSQHWVVSGKRLRDLRQLNQALDLKAEDCADKGTAERLRKEKQRAAHQSRYQADRQDPEKMAKRQAWFEANAEERKAYMKQWLAKNKERMRELARNWALKKYHEAPELGRKKQRDYYHANREAILAKLKVKRDAAKAAKAALQGPQP